MFLNCNNGVISLQQEVEAESSDFHDAILREYDTSPYHFLCSGFLSFTFMEDLPNKDYLGGMHLFCHGFKDQTVGA